ncbi:MAG: helix-turn-helix transcriptional regulator [Oleiphilus sp.]
MQEIERLLPLEAVIDQIGLGSTTIYEMINEGKFPPPRKIRSRTARWLESEIQTWIKDTVLECDGEIE